MDLAVWPTHILKSEAMYVYSYIHPFSHIYEMGNILSTCFRS